RLGPRPDQLLARPLASAVDNQWIAGLEQVLRHGTAHDSEPNESNDLRHGDLVGTGWEERQRARTVEYHRVARRVKAFGALAKADGLLPRATAHPVGIELADFPRL